MMRYKTIFTSLLLLLVLWGCGGNSTSNNSAIRAARIDFDSLDANYTPEASVYKQADSLEQIAIKHHDDSLRLAIMCLKAGYFSDVHYVDKQDSVLKAAAPLVRDEYTVLALTYYRLLALYEDSRNHYPEAIKAFKLAEQAAERDMAHVDSSLLALLYTNTASTYSSIGRNQDAQAYITKGRNILNKLNDVYAKMSMDATEAKIYMQADAPEEAIEVLDEGIKAVEQEPEVIPYKNFLRLRRAEAYLVLLMKKRPQAISADSLERTFQDILSLEQANLKRDYLLSIIYSNLSEVCMLTGQLQRARAYLLEAEKYSEDTSYTGNLMELDIRIGMLNKDNVHLPEQIRALRHHIDSANLPNPESAVEAYKTLSNAYQYLGNAEEALRMRDSITLYEDSVQRVEKMRVATEARIGRELNESLRSLEQEQSFSRSMIYAFVALVLLVTVLGVGTYYYNVYRRKEYWRLMQDLQSEQETQEDSQCTLSDELRLRIEEGLSQMMEVERIYKDNELTIESLARRIGTNRTSLAEYFKQVLNKSYKDYISAYRIAEAKKLLMYKSKTIEEVAEEVGMSSSSLNALFKRSEGISPAQWRKQNIS